MKTLKSNLFLGRLPTLFQYNCQIHGLKGMCVRDRSMVIDSDVLNLRVRHI